MTPTEQGDDRAKLIIEMSNLLHRHFQAQRKATVEAFANAQGDLANFITADRKRVALEAELELLTYLLDERTEGMFMQNQDTGEMTGNGWLCNTSLSAVSANRIEAERRKRIAELKAQQEEV